MGAVSTLDFAIRLGVGLGCGALIGMERQWRARMAGLRTNALVATGATLFVLYSTVVGNANSTQVAAYVVSGVGFLGGGVILRDGFNVRGLNTAATLWCSAAVGVLAASGRLAFAALATVVVLLIHLLGRPLGHLIDRDERGGDDEGLRPYTVSLVCRVKREPHVRALLAQSTRSGAILLRGMDTTRSTDDDTRLTAQLLLDGDAPTRLEELIARLSLEPGIRAVRWSADLEPETPLADDD